MTYLSAQQQAIVDATLAAAHRGRMIFVRAGAGTGKTTALVAAVLAWLDAHPHRRAVLVTFSRAATDELTRRLGVARGRVTVTTFDALLHRLIRREDPRAKFIGAVEDRKLLHDALHATYGANLPTLLPGSLRAGIVALHRAAETNTPLLDPYAELLATAGPSWTAAKHERCLYSSGDTRRWLRANLDQVTDALAAAADSLLVVDEAQDCEAAEVALLAHAIGQPAFDRLLVAHDPNQNVNRFRGAVPGLSAALRDVAVPLSVLDLTVNRRSHQPIVDVCREFLASQGLPMLVDADLARPAGARPRLVVADDPGAMIAELAAALSVHNASTRSCRAARERLGLPADLAPEQSLVITRTNRDAEAVVRGLLDNGIAAIQYAARRNPYDTPGLALLWAWCAPTLADQTGGHDPTGTWALTTVVTEAFARYGGSGRADLRREHLRQITTAIYERGANGAPFAETRAACRSLLADHVADTALPSRLRDDCWGTVAVLDRWIELDAGNAPPSTRVERLLRFFPKLRGGTVHAATTKGERRGGRSSWHPAARHLAAAPAGPGALDRHVRRMIALGGSHARARSLDEFRAWTLPIFGTQPIVVMTAHTAKGREADHVIVAFADAGKWPLDRRDDGIAELDEDDLADEEACVFYVALSRARNTLTLLSSGSPTPYVDQSSPTWHVV